METLSQRLLSVLKTVKDNNYPDFEKGIMGLTGYMNDEQITSLIDMINNDPEITTSIIIEKAFEFVQGL